MARVVSAVFSACGRYRYRLDRVVGGPGPPVAFLLHNPSTADAVSDDGTLRRGIGFARSWGASRLVFVNAWAGIATRPQDLWAMADPVGPANHDHVAQAACELVEEGGFMLFACGRVHPPAAMRAAARRHLGALEDGVRALGCRVCVLGRNQDGSPKHPLYVRRGALPQDWPPGG
jgi:hypothetical protein